MKRILTTLLLMATIAASAAAMSFSKARKEALFLSDKMAYELSLSLSQYEAVYEINLDYLLGLRSRLDVDGVYWLRRNADLRYVLSSWQWERYTHIADFYRPMVWVSGSRFALSLRARYANKNFFYYDRPAIYGSYRGGHNAGQQSYYAGRDFNRPATGNGPQRYGSSAPAPQGSSRGNSKTQPSYNIGTPAPNGSGNTNSGSVRGRSGGNAGTGNSSTRPATGSNSSSRSAGNTSRSSSSSRSNTNTGSSRGGR